MEEKNYYNLAVNKYLVPDTTARTLTHWILSAGDPGSFGRAVLCNDLKESIGRADSTNLLALRNIVAFLYNEAPMECWGSVESFNSWKGIRNE